MSQSLETGEAYDRLVSVCGALIGALGEDRSRPGLLGTPDRFARFWLEFINHDPGNVATTFESVTTDQMVVVKGMRVWSVCEHHLLPFWCDVSVGYITRTRVLGLSKFARIAHKHAHRLQIQERLVEGVAEEVANLTGSPDVAVLASGVHTCMVMRGVRTDGVMISSVMRGVFREESSARSEFLSLVA